MDLIESSVTAFDGARRFASGTIEEVAAKIKQSIGESSSHSTILVFNDFTGQLLDIDFRGTQDDVVQRLRRNVKIESNPTANENLNETSRMAGRPKLGVVAREVTLLPRHWQWLNLQPGGASVTLRKLVEEARIQGTEKDRVRQAQEAAYCFMSSTCGDRQGFEDAARALFRREESQFDKAIEFWPVDLREHAKKIATPGL